MRRIVVAVLVTLLWPAAAAVSLAFGVRGETVSVIGCILLAIGTSGAYALDRLRDGGDSRDVQFLLKCFIAASAIAALALLYREPWRAGLVLALAVLAIGYVPLKRTLPKNAIAATAWTLAVVVLPGHAAPTFGGEFLQPGLAVACIMFANTTICDFTTIAEDRGHGVISISVCYGITAARVVAFLVAASGVMLAFADSRNGLAVCAVFHALIVLAMPRASRLWADAALLLPGLVFFL